MNKTKKREGAAAITAAPGASGDTGLVERTASSLLTCRTDVNRKMRGSRLQKIEQFWKEARIFGILTKSGSICSGCLSSKEKARAGIESLIFPNDLLKIAASSLACKRCKEAILFGGSGGDYIKKIILDEVEKAMAKATA